jgi:hypothetical protein
MPEVDAALKRAFAEVFSGPTARDVSAPKIKSGPA